MFKAIINFGNEDKFMRIEGAELPARPRDGDMIHVDASKYGSNFVLGIEEVDQRPDGILILGCKLIEGEIMPPQVPIVGMCIWTLVDEDQWGNYWQPGCKDDGIDGTIADDEDGPLQWGWNYCPFCRSPIVQRSPNEV